SSPWRKRASRRFIFWGVVVMFVGVIGWVGVGGYNSTQAAEPTMVEEWLTQIMKRLLGRGSPRTEQPPPKVEPQRPSPGVLRLTLDQAMALFLKENLDLLMANFGVDAAKGRQITARLFPNPVLAVNTFSSYTQGCTLNRCGAVAPSVTQLFEVAGRRGF